MQRTKLPFKELKLPDAINCSLTKNFTQVPNNLLRNPNITSKAKAILCLLLSNKEISSKNVFNKEFLNELERKILRLKRKGNNPQICTHNLYNENQDAILNNLKKLGLTNKKEDKVKVVFYPIYLSGADGLLNTTYHESMAGSHLGIFPSSYEPWGYTPLECGALGVSSITTDLAGFGRYINNKNKQKKNSGIYVLKRMNKSKEDVVDDLTTFMYKFTELNKTDRINNKIAAHELASTADWKYFIKNYIQAHNLAIKNGTS